MRSRSCRPEIMLIVPAGVLLGHALAYFVVGEGHGSAHHEHGYLALATSLAAPLGVAGLLAAAVRPGRASQPTTPPISLATIVLLQATLFVAQEGIEHAAVGHDLASFVGSPLLWTGLVAQATVAVGLALAVHTAGVVGGHVLLFPPQLLLHRVTAVAEELPACSWLLPAPVAFGRATGRGPPSSPPEPN